MLARIFTRLFVYLLGVFFLSTSFGFAQTDVENFAPVKGPLNVAALTSHFEYYADKNWDVDIDTLASQETSIFQPINMSEPDFGYIKDRTWLRARLHNTTTDVSHWRLYVRENFLQNYAVYVQRDSGVIETIEEQTPDTKFSDRLIDYPELVTPITFHPGEKITLYIAYWSEGSSNAAMSLETTQSFSDIAVTRTSKNYIFYGVMGILMLASGLALMILRLRVFSAYLGYVLLTLFYLMHVDGVTFQYFWPHFPRFNSYFTILIGTAFILVTYNFARVFLQTKEFHPRADRILFWMGLISSIIIIPGSWIDPQLTKQFIMPLILIGIISGTITGFVAARTRFKQVQFYLYAWMFGVFSSGLMNMRHVFGFDISQDTEFDTIRVAIVVDAVMMGLGIADRYIQSVKQREKATQANLMSAQQNLRLSQRLSDLEGQYVLVTELVESRDEDLKNTIHDLRQPLHALRLNIQRGMDTAQPSDSDSAQINDTFSFLENLLSAQLNTALNQPALPHAEQRSDAAEEVSVQDILKSVHEMFLPDAQDKGLDFRFVPSRHEALVKPFTLIRILNNLVSNAIKYTPHGKILLGSRRIDDTLRIEIHDTGIGMSAAAFETAKGRQVRLEEGRAQADGAGLGLSIAAKLAEENGLTLSLSAYRATGTTLILEIPVHS